MIYDRHLAITVIVAIMVTAFCALPADARAKKKSKYRADTAPTLSLDGRNLGRARSAVSTLLSTTASACRPAPIATDPSVRFENKRRAGAVVESEWPA
jgi:hypothetical protein